jgi:cytosine/adenosine deaminase-related metal-dependent hydrolase
VLSLRGSWRAGTRPNAPRPEPARPKPPAWLPPEARLAFLLQRVSLGAGAMSAREMLEIATLGGARVLGRDDIGALAPGMAADFITVPLTDIGLAGAHHDPVAALLFCQVPQVRHAVVNGRVVVRDGQLATLSLPRLVEHHNRLASQLIR